MHPVEQKLFGESKKVIAFPFDKDVWAWQKTLSKEESLALEAKMVAIARQAYLDATGAEKDEAWGKDLTSSVRG